MANNVSFFITADSEVDFTKEFKMQKYTRTFIDDSWEVTEAIELEKQPFMENLGQKWEHNIEDGSLENYYDWYCENVGAKWCNIEEVDECQVYGYSAWSPPIEMLGHLAKYMKTGLRMNYEDEFRNFIGVAWADPIHGDTSYEEIEGEELVEQLCEELGIEELPDDFEWWDEYGDSGIIPQEWMDDAVDNWFGEQ